MKPTLKILIKFWKNWKPTYKYISPSTVSDFYWDKYWSYHRFYPKCYPRPIFLEGEINDLIAVISGSKPAALCILKNNLPLAVLPHRYIKTIYKQVVKYCKKHNIPIKISNSCCLIAKTKELLDGISSFSGEIGYSLGYPPRAINDFNKHKNKRGIGKPHFPIAKEWFESPVEILHECAWCHYKIDDKPIKDNSLHFQCPVCQAKDLEKMHKPYEKILDFLQKQMKTDKRPKFQERSQEAIEKMKEKISEKNIQVH